MDLTIDRLETVIIDVPLRRPHRFARVAMTAQPVLLAFVHTRDGVVGVGEGVVPGGPWWGGESVESMKVTLDTYVAPLLPGRSVADLAGLWSDISDRVGANLYAKCAVEVALHDAWARTLGVPVHVLLGGLARTSVDVTWALGAEPEEVVVEEALTKLRAGHRSFKLKMGALPPDEDTRRVCAIAEKLTGTAGVRVDLNARWDFLTARTYLPRLAAAGVELVEQPVPGEQVEALAELNSLLPIPVMADESLRTPVDALRLVSLRAADIWSIKTTKLGGLRRSRDIVGIAAAAGIPCHGGTSIETGIGTAASLQLACAAPGVTWGSELFGPLLFTEEILRTPLSYFDGALQLPDGPGLGVELNPEAVTALRRPHLTKET
ncbi:muconate/chloromuconate family cycloisomerase [Kribbella pratensis]|uniref:Muconate cycloisomerase n=1 Tax=Kribbella pratensis TaxID=2512112 RepID=A0A4R8C256_9ACTN|nr:muconate/chloromuconate family cycloisomerase [Kribbella pratensis]TDW69840.1 muconate cycloisomerase [Kribbella pratensis]